VYDFGQPAGVASQNVYSTPAPLAPTPTEQPKTAMMLTASSESHSVSVERTPGFSHKQQVRAAESAIKQVVSEKPKPAKPIRFEKDLKRSVFFVAGGVILLILGSDILVVLGSLCLLIGAIFGIKWFLNR